MFWWNFTKGKGSQRYNNYHTVDLWTKLHNKTVSFKQLIKVKFLVTKLILLA